MKKLRLGIIGIGNIGTTHASNIKKGSCPEIEITAIADINPDKIAAAKEQEYDKDITYFDNATDMLDSGLVDACIVAVPHYDHTTLAIECIKRGIHVMVEKPAGVYTKQVRELIKVSEEHPEVVFGMMFNQRTNCLYRKLKELVSSGEYGEIRRTNWLITAWYRPQAYYDSGEWRATWVGEGGGVLLNQCPHQLDLWQWICGMPVKVHAKLHYGKWHDIEVEDDVTAYVEYANGATGCFISSTGDAKGTNRFEIQMDKAKFVVENGKLKMDEFEISEPEFTRTNTNTFGSIKSTSIEVETDGQHTSHAGVMNSFADAILHGGKLVAELKASDAAKIEELLGLSDEL
jgi:predicted dehydrogenase